MDNELIEIFRSITGNIRWEAHSREILISASNVLVAKKIQDQNEIYEKLLKVNTELLETQKELLKRV